MTTLNNQVEVNASEAKLHFGEFLNQCLYADKEVIIRKHDKPVAVLVSLEKWGKRGKPAKEKSKEHPLWLELQRIRASIRKHQKKMGVKDTQSSVELIRELRDEREAKY